MSQTKYYIFCLKSTYPYFEEYALTLKNTMTSLGHDVSIAIERELPLVNIIRAPKGQRYVLLVFQEVPEYLMPLTWMEHCVLALINTEQLSQIKWAQTMQKWLTHDKCPLIDYSEANTGYLSLSSDRVFIVPYQYDEEEVKHLKALRQPYKWDVAFCGTLSPRRQHILNELRSRGVSVKEVQGWKDARDSEIAQCRILLNIHFREDYQVFESYRCDRWIFASKVVVTETSTGQQNFDLNKLITVVPYEELVDKVIEVLSNFENRSHIVAENCESVLAPVIEARRAQLQKCLTKLDSFDMISRSFKEIVPKPTPAPTPAPDMVKGKTQINYKPPDVISKEFWLTSQTEDKMLVLLFGGNGWIGNQLRALMEQHKIRHIIASSRADDVQGCEKEIDQVKPTHVFCLVGRTHGPGNSTIDYLEEKGKLYENVRDNLFAPISLAITCQKRKIHLTYLGTGCIFQYDRDHPDSTYPSAKGFTEEDKPNFFGSSYSCVKSFTDRLVHMFPDTVLNARIRMPITADRHPRNFITKIVHYDKICSRRNSMSVLPDMLPILLDLAQKKQTGTFNLTNPGTISHNEILAMYREIVDPSFKWENFSDSEQKTILKAERSNNALDTTKLQKLYPTVPHIHEAVKTVLKQMAKESKRRTLVSGGLGMLASNLINFLNDKGEETVIIDKLDYCASRDNIKNWDMNSLYIGDICDDQLVMRILRDHKIDTVFHCAANTHVDNSYKNSLKFTQNNVVGTHTLAECCRIVGISKFIHVSTDEVYGGVDLSTTCSEEVSLMKPTNDYAATKSAAESILHAYYCSHKLPVVILRCNNFIGKNQFPDKLIPKFIKLLVEGKKCPIHGDGSARRTFIHVEDVCRALEILRNKGVPGQVYNVGTGSEYEFSVLEITQLLIERIKPETKLEPDGWKKWIEFIPDRVFQDQRYSVATHKIEALGWKPQVTWDHAINTTIEHYVAKYQRNSIKYRRAPRNMRSAGDFEDE